MKPPGKRSAAHSGDATRRPFFLERACSPGTRNALVLQGGGALGAYQAGAYSVLSESGSPLHWVVGVSIGAINAALIAGNSPETRVDRLREFWRQVSSAPAQRLPGWWGEQAWRNQLSASAALMFGIPDFFVPRDLRSLMSRPRAAVPGVYDTAPLKRTLMRLVDFDRINAGHMRFAVGAVEVNTGNSVYFDNVRHKIRPEHVMASGALPPGFPGVEIEGVQYWDGGVVSNTPLQYLLDSHARDERLLAFQVDLFSARGETPQSLPKVMERRKDINYSSRTRMNTDALAANLNLQQSIRALIKMLPLSLRRDPEVLALSRQLRSKPIDIVHLIYRDKPCELESKDYDFSRYAVEEHWNAGARDMRTALEHPELLDANSDRDDGVTTFDLGAPGRPSVRRPGSTWRASAS